MHKGRPLCRGILLERRMPVETCLNSTCHWAVSLSEFLKFSIHILELLEQIARTWLHTADTYSLILLQVRNTQSGSGVKVKGSAGSSPEAKVRIHSLPLPVSGGCLAWVSIPPGLQDQHLRSSLLPLHVIFSSVCVQSPFLSPSYDACV